jgi:hypothetical protein
MAVKDRMIERVTNTARAIFSPVDSPGAAMNGDSLGPEATKPPAKSDPRGTVRPSSLVQISELTSIVRIAHRFLDVIFQTTREPGDSCASTQFGHQARGRSSALQIVDRETLTRPAGTLSRGDRVRISPAGRRCPDEAGTDEGSGNRKGTMATCVGLAGYARIPLTTFPWTFVRRRRMPPW